MTATEATAAEAGRGFSTDKSAALHERLARSTPGGDTRSVTFYPPFPLSISRGQGYLLWDVDGNEYIDLLNNYASLVHGHAHPAITEQISKQAERGTVFPAPSVLQAELAERLIARVDSIDLLRFANSGSEAVMTAVRVARRFTGREAIVKVDGGYHGSWDQVPMVIDGSYSAGTPDAVLDLIEVVDYNDIAELEAAMQRRGHEAAAIILEPVMGEGVVAGAPEFFAAARQLADDYGALLIVDEVVTLRLATGGYQSVLGVRPDLTTMGKFIGGGLPVGAVGGSEEVMKLFDPSRTDSVHHSGTFNGNALTMAAGCVAVDLLDEAVIDRINGLGERLAAGLRRELPAAGLPCRVTNVGSLVHFHFEIEADAPTRFADLNLGSETLRALHRASLEEGVYFAPRGLLNLSTAHTEQSVDETIDRFARAAKAVAAALDRNGST